MVVSVLKYMIVSLFTQRRIFGECRSADFSNPVIKCNADENPRRSKGYPEYSLAEVAAAIDKSLTGPIQEHQKCPSERASVGR